MLSLQAAATQERWAPALAVSYAALVCLLLMATPWVWRIPLLAKVQFPWRLLMPMELAQAVSGVALLACVLQLSFAFGRLAQDKTVDVAARAPI